jgi:hypothetical protein
MRKKAWFRREVMAFSILKVLKLLYSFKRICFSTSQEKCQEIIQLLKTALQEWWVLSASTTLYGTGSPGDNRTLIWQTFWDVSHHLKVEKREVNEESKNKCESESVRQ